MKLTDHFELSEFYNTSYKDLLEENKIESSKNIANIVKTAKMLEEIRSVVNTSVIITSGFRCENLNRTVGGVYNSKHLYGLAADIRFKHVQLEYAFRLIIESDIKSIRKCILENVNGRSWIHVSYKEDESEPTEFYTTKNGKNYERVFKR